VRCINSNCTRIILSTAGGEGGEGEASSLKDRANERRTARANWEKKGSDRKGFTICAQQPRGLLSARVPQCVRALIDDVVGVGTVLWITRGAEIRVSITPAGEGR